jgi:uncharacterized Rmd1/YagE family protein
MLRFAFGQLFIVKSSVNLESDMLSVPDFFWENEVWEPIFKHACKYLDIDDRVAVVNKRLEVLDGMFQMLKDQLEVRHATRLEWIIIWLIVAEVGLELVWNILIKDSENAETKVSTTHPLSSPTCVLLTVPDLSGGAVLGFFPHNPPPH